MRKAGRRGAAGLAAVALAAGLLAGCSGGGGGARATFVFPDAANLIAGSRVLVDGFAAGRVTSLTAKGGKAFVQVRVDSAHSPLREGTTARISYQSLLGERVVDVLPAPAANAELPDGAVIAATTSRVELDQLFNALDPDTRAAVSRAFPGLDAALAGREGDAKATIDSAGPALDALAEILQAVGSDGPALHRLLRSLQDLSARLVARQDSVRQTIDGFDRNLEAVSGQAGALGQAIDKLPGTLSVAQSTLSKVPGASAAAVPLLRDLLPAAQALPAAAADLRPFLADLRPTLVDLKPTVAALSALLVETPGMFDRAHSVLPPVTGLVAALLPAIDFLRPYTPELAGAVANFASASANYDRNGHYIRIFVSSGSAFLDDSPFLLNPALSQHPGRKPGELVGQPAVVDAAGSSVR
ncbi:MAG TPA: MlaD family protein [Acidimicrobiia bacterium]|nr:MlaD family protein [Acidimicrobiia bacterium]